MVTRKLYPASAVAHLLGTALGIGIQWIDKLNDFRQDRTDMKGLMLHPVGRARGTPTHAAEPRYCLEHVRDFIDRVREAYGCAKPFLLVVDSYEYDESAEAVASSWRYRRLAKVARGAAGR
jgi:hypothetical protein